MNEWSYFLILKGTIWRYLKVMHTCRERIKK
jgi:hypothetical protein